MSLTSLFVSAVNSTSGETFGDVPTLFSAIQRATKRRRLNTSGTAHGQSTRSKSMPARGRRKTSRSRAVYHAKRKLGRILRRRGGRSARVSSRFPMRNRRRSTRQGFGRRGNVARYNSAISIPRPVFQRTQVIRKFVILANFSMNPLANKIMTSTAASQFPTIPSSWDHLPMGWLETSAFFKQYRVVGAKLTVTYISGFVSEARALHGVRLMSDVARVTYNGALTRDYQEQGRLSNGICLAGRNQVAGMKSVSATFSAKRWWPKDMDMESQYALATAPTPADPPIVLADPVGSLTPTLTPWYALLPAAPQVDRVFDSKLELTVHFRQPEDL